MWLRPENRAQPGVSAHQFALYRICVGLIVLLLLGAAPASDVPSELWLSLPRGLRAGLRLGAAAAGLALMLGLVRRVSGPSAGAIAAAHALYGHTSWGVAGPLLIAGVLLAQPTAGEPWALSRQNASFGVHAHWSTAAWAGVFANGVIVSLDADSGLLGWTLAVLAAASCVAVFVSGPRPALALSALGVLFVSALSSGSVATVLAAVVPAALAAITHDWLPPRPSRTQHPIVFFDGVCAVCNWSVRLIVAEDMASHLKLAPLQGNTSSERLGHESSDSFDSIVLLDGNERLEKSAAALRIAAYMGGVWRLCGMFNLLPRRLLDAAYDTIANNRYDWFGKLDACRLPTAKERKRFLE